MSLHDTWTVMIFGVGGRNIFVLCRGKFSTTTNINNNNNYNKNCDFDNGNDLVKIKLETHLFVLRGELTAQRNTTVRCQNAGWGGTATRNCERQYRP
jgi:hypothetical protein